MTGPQHISKRAQLSFVDLSTGGCCSTIWPLLRGGYWRSARPEYQEKHLLGAPALDAAPISFFADHAAIHPGQQWNHRDRRVEPMPFPKDAMLAAPATFLHAAEKFFLALGSAKIAVQVSGGVDSSIIIGLLRLFGIPHMLIGMTSLRYEFRTERHVQEKLCSAASAARLIPYEEYLPFSQVEAVPVHQCPDVAALSASSQFAMAEACRAFGVDVLLTGAGGDVLLGCDLSGNKWPPYHPDFFNEPWLQEVVYTPAGVTLLSFFSDIGVAASLCKLRLGSSADPKKFWSRQHFRELLPREVVDWVYKADFWGLYMDGQLAAIPDLRDMHTRAFAVSNNHYFCESQLELLLSRDLMECDKNLYQLLEMRFSAALWFVKMHSYSATSSL